MEFSASRDAFKIIGDAFQFSLIMINSDWAEVGRVITLDKDDKIIVKMDKQ
jgi:hypothetical protein